jgi:hypothetical protein
MDDFVLNEKCLEVKTFMPRGKRANPRLKYLAVSKQGVTAFHPQGIMRVSLPPDSPAPKGSRLIPQKVVDKIGGDCKVSIEETVPAHTTPDFLVPEINSIIPDPDEQTATITVNGELLLRLIKAAVAVSEDPEKTIRIRHFPNEAKIRIDIYREPGKQEFVGVLCELEYYGDMIPGDRNEVVDALKKSGDKPKPTSLTLRTNAGRKFRS